MTTLYWQIAPELEQLRRQAERMLEERGQAPTTPQIWKPAAELQDLGDRYELQLQLPAIDRNSLDIQATQDSVVVKGDRPATTEAKLIHSEFRHGAFERKVGFPEAVQHQAIAARYDQGLLSLTVPKLTAAPDYRVKVAVSSGGHSEEPVESEVTPGQMTEESAIAEDLWADPSV